MKSLFAIQIGMNERLDGREQEQQVRSDYLEPDNTKLYKIQVHQTKPNQIKSNQTKSSQTKPNQGKQEQMVQVRSDYLRQSECISDLFQVTTPNWSRGHFDMFLKVNSPRFVGELTSKVNSRLEYATKIILVVWCKIVEGRIWVLVPSRVV